MFFITGVTLFFYHGFVFFDIVELKADIDIDFEIDFEIDFDIDIVELKADQLYKWLLTQLRAEDSSGAFLSHSLLQLQS